MKRFIFAIILFIIGFICLNFKVYAATGNGEEYKTYYDKGLQKINVSGTQMITLYGKSVCNGSTCPTVLYAGQFTDFKEALKNTVVCTNGEKYISYQIGTSGKSGAFDNSNSADNYSGDMYWGEEYQVTCISNNNGSSTVLETVTTNSNNQNNQNNQLNNSGGYNSATPENNPGTGVSTYFVVLGLVALVSYFCMIIVKKHNLFKNI